MTKEERDALTALWWQASIQFCKDHPFNPETPLPTFNEWLAQHNACKETPGQV